MAIIAFDPEYEGMLISKQAEEAGLVGIGGNLSIKSLLSAYSSGLFPGTLRGSLSCGGRLTHELCLYRKSSNYRIAYVKP